MSKGRSIKLSKFATCVVCSISLFALVAKNLKQENSDN